MPDQQDRDAIDGLFDRIDDVARKNAPRDSDAEALIQQRLRDFLPAPYYVAQTILVQEQALRLAQERIEQLEAQAQPRSGFLGGLFGDDQSAQQRQVRQRGPWDRQRDDNRRGQGGGFLAGAAQTALGVTTGVLLGSAVAGIFTGGAQASEYTPDANADQGNGDVDSGGDFDMGGDF